LVSYEAFFPYVFRVFLACLTTILVSQLFKKERMKL